MECGLSSLVYSFKIVYRDNMYIIAFFYVFVSAPQYFSTEPSFPIFFGGRWGKNKVGKSLGFSHLWRISDSAGTQTQDPQLRRLLLYSAELPNQILLGLMHKNVL